MATPAERAFAMEMARIYRLRGINVLPSREDAKRPYMRYADLWETMAPAEWFEEANFPQTANLQAMLGVYWKLLAVDIDGAEARRRFESMGYIPKTWVTHRTGGDSWHFLFKLPKDFSRPMPSFFAWKGQEKHSGIEILCDRRLIVMPPSRHVKTGAPYKFMDKWHSPEMLGHPAVAPDWILRLRPVPAESVPRVVVPPVRPARPRVAAPASGHLDRDEVLARIPDKVGLARSWGLRIAGRPNERGWTPAHGIGRPDNHPSAAIHRDTGAFVDLGTGERLSFYDLGVRLGVFHDFRDALQQLSLVAI